MIKKSKFMLAFVAASLVAIFSSGCGRTNSLQLKERQDKAASELELILSEKEPRKVRPAPGNHISVLLRNRYGRDLLERIDKNHALFSFSPESEEYVLIWNGPSVFGQVMFTGNSTIGMLAQVYLQRVVIQNDRVVLGFTVSEDNWTRSIGLKPDVNYEVDFNVAKVTNVDFIKIWENATQQETEPDSP